MKTVVAAIALAVLVAGSLGVGYLAGSGAQQTVTTTSTVFLTETATPVQATSLSRSNGDWDFSIRLQNPLTAMGQGFALSYNLTNVSGQPQMVHVVAPLINPTIYSANGSVVWAWNPPTMNYFTTIPSRPGNWSAPLDVSTSGLGPGRYVLSVWPLIGVNTTSPVEAGNYSIGESLMVNDTFVVE